MAQNERNKVRGVPDIKAVGNWLRDKGAQGAKIGARYWRRSSTRALGLFFNGIERVNEMVMG
jgi:hypothetical protein